MEDQLVTARDARAQSESRLKDVKRKQSNVSDDLSVVKKRNTDVERDHEKVAAEVKLLEAQQAEIRSKMLVEKRAASKGNRQQEQLETSKQRQDLLVDHLNEAIAKLQSKIKLTNAQLLAQQEETKEAKQACRDAAEQVEVQDLHTQPADQQ